MIYTLATHTVEDFAKWKTVFDGSIEMRKSAGELSFQVFQDASDQKKVTVLNEWESKEKAETFFDNPHRQSDLA